MQIETRISGIPCLIEASVNGTYTPAKTDADPGRCYEAEYPEIEFDVLDRRGRPAPWLAKKLTQADTNRIENLILETQEEY